MSYHINLAEIAPVLWLKSWTSEGDIDDRWIQKKSEKVHKKLNWHTGIDSPK
jgi:hypothetical protein